MGTIETAAMTKKFTGNMGVSKEAVKKVSRAYDIRDMSMGEVAWFQLTQHWVGLLATVGVTYIVFDNFGTLIVGLVKGLFN